MPDPRADPLLYERILDRALERGMVPREVLEKARRRLAVPGSPPVARDLVETLLKQGDLDAAQVADLGREILKDPPSGDPPAGPPATGVPRSDPLGPTHMPERDRVVPREESSLSGGAPHGSAPGRQPAEGMARYTGVTPIGEGGMAQVFKAFDPHLKRRVALKFLRVEHPDLTARLLREAQIQARVEHPNVCRVYEAGTLDGRPYIAMQFIDGQTLDRAAREMTLEQVVLAVKTVAEAVHAAHRMGLIHRDMKPGNVMVERGEDGSLTPFVMDFGLAREMAAPDLSATGSITGTPHYMAPEQVKGDAPSLDRRTDVHGLGATLYELFAGRPPYQGNTAMDVLIKVLSETPKPLRAANPSVPADLETIVAKCLEKEPGRRYDSAKALAEDLGRFLDGEPILAVPPSLPYRILKRARKHKALVAVAAAAVVAVGISAGLAVRARWQARAQLQIASQFDQEVQVLETRQRYAYTTPGRDLKEDRAAVQGRLKSIRDAMEARGRLAAGPGNYALGRAELVLGDVDAARAHLEAAWNRYGFRTPQVAYALGMALALAYQKGLADAERIPEKVAREERRAELGSALRDPALAYFRLGRRAAVDAPQYGEALVALLQKRYSDALSLADAALRTYPWMYEVERLKGQVYLAQGQEDRAVGNTEEAAGRFAQAEAAYDRAIRRAPNDVNGYVGLATLENELMVLQVYSSGASPQAAFDMAVAACERGAALDPSEGRIFEEKTYACWRWGEYLLMHGQDPRQVLASAVEAGTRAVELLPASSHALNELGSAYYIQGQAALARGEDPAPTFADGLAAYRKALALDPRDAAACVNMGGIFGNMAQVELEHGRDPRPALRQAVAAYERAIAINPRDYYAYNNLAVAHGIQGQYEMEHGADPAASFAGTEAANRRSVSLNPKQVTPHVNMGFMSLLKAEYEEDSGRDPSASFEQALRAFQAVVAINPKYPLAYAEMADVYRRRAEHALERDHRLAQADVDSARQSLARLEALNPKMFELFLVRGQLGLLQARWLEGQGLAPEAAFEAARADVARAMVLKPSDYLGHATMAQVERRQAEWLDARGRTPAENVRRGLAEAAQALALNPRASDAFVTRGSLLLLRARYERDGARRQTAKAAEAALTQAVACNPLAGAEATPLLGEARRLQSP